MSVPIIQLRTRASNADRLRGLVPTETDVVVKLEGDADVYKPDGTHLCMLRRRAVPETLCESAYPALHKLRSYKTDNRGAYAGATRTQAVFEDGTVSKNSRTRDAHGKRFLVASAVVGYFDKQGGRFPFCRETAFTGKFPAEWATIAEMSRHVASLMKVNVPNRYALQAQACLKCPAEYVIPGTPFTTLTVNNNVAPAATHTDKGDFKDGMGIISVVRRGSYSGAWLCFPEYLVGVDLRDGDVFFFNSHDWHGVTPMVKESEDAERISVVYYMREKMLNCLPAKEQLKVLHDKQIVVTGEEGEEGEEGEDGGEADLS